MYINGIEFPNQLLRAVNQNKLVVFAGAGASMGKPTSLPNFYNLAERIAEGTGYELQKNDACDIFLGKIKHEGVDVNTSAAKILSGECIEHNILHEAIIDLFPDSSNIKIVTTNYDEMFEQVLDRRGIVYKVYDVPAIPLGDDINGIIHIHGKITNPKYMVVTDEDFGKAYLTEGYASHFLVKLFEAYTVLFVGYSYNDTIMRYLTRAISRNGIKKRYILSNEHQKDWASLGITPIYFKGNKKVNSFDNMTDALIKLGIRSKRGFIDWKNVFEEVATNPPKDLTIESEVVYCLEDINRMRLMAQSISGEEWMDYLDKKGVFKELFQKDNELTPKACIWVEWINSKFVGNEDEALKRLLLRHENNLSYGFANKIIRSIISSYSKDKISKEYFREYLVLLNDYIDNELIIFQLIKLSLKKGLNNTALLLFEKYFKITFILERNYWDHNSLTYKHTFIGSGDFIQKSWSIGNMILMNHFSRKIMQFGKGKIENLHAFYTEVGMASKDKEPWRISMLDIEKYDLEYDSDPLRLLCEYIFQCAKNLQTSESDFIRDFTRQCLESESVLVRKLGLKLLREIDLYDADEKYKLLKHTNGISFLEGKEQVFKLIASIIQEMSGDNVNELLEAIENINSYHDERTNAYAKFNWYVWLLRYCSNEKIVELKNNILKENDFEEREHPELDYVVSSSVQFGSRSPISYETMYSMEWEQLREMLQNFNREWIDGPDRYGLLNVFGLCVKDNFSWAESILKKLVICDDIKTDVWQAFFNGVLSSSFTVDNKISILEVAVTEINRTSIDFNCAELLRDVTTDDTFEKNADRNIEKLFKIGEIIWDNRKLSEIISNNLVEYALNSSTGLILLSWVSLLSYSNDNSIPNNYKRKFEDALDLQGEERRIAICVLAGHFAFFYLRDRTWTTEKIIPIIKGEPQQEFVAAWDGIVCFSRRINIDIADVMSEVYLKAAHNLAYLSDETRTEFIYLYLTLCIYVVKNPLHKHIPTLLRNADKEDKKRFASEIRVRLKNMDKSEKGLWWSSWLRDYWKNRINNKPIRFTEYENAQMLMWLLELDKLYPEAVDIVCEGKLPKTIGYSFLLSMDESELIQKYPCPTLKLMIALLKNGTDFQAPKEELVRIIKQLNIEDEEQKTILTEELLKRGVLME